jgi:predicted amidophosphoribosyltransferase
MITLFPDIFKRAPDLCVKCGKSIAEFGPYCGECCINLQHEIAEAWRKDQEFYKEKKK